MAVTADRLGAGSRLAELLTELERRLDERYAFDVFAANSNGVRFRDAVRPRVTRLIDETPIREDRTIANNNCYHLELSR